MKILVTPSGFESRSIISFIVKEGISRDDQVIIIRPKEKKMDEKARSALSEIENFLKMVYDEIDIKLELVETANMNLLLIDLLDLFKNLQGEIVVNTYGSIREITMGLTIISLLFKQKISKIYYYSRIEEEVLLFEPPNIVFPLEGMEKRILETIEKSKVTNYEELANLLKISKSTISRTIHVLKEKELIQIKTNGKRKVVELTTSGRLLANL